MPHPRRERPRSGFCSAATDSSTTSSPPATLTIYGWLGSSNTATVPNGTYVLRSAASGAGGISGNSPPVGITVSNRREPRVGLRGVTPILTIPLTRHSPFGSTPSRGPRASSERGGDGDSGGGPMSVEVAVPPTLSSGDVTGRQRATGRRRRREAAPRGGTHGEASDERRGPIRSPTVRGCHAECRTCPWSRSCAGLASAREGRPVDF